VICKHITYVQHHVNHACECNDAFEMGWVQLQMGGITSAWCNDGSCNGVGAIANRSLQVHGAMTGLAMGWVQLQMGHYTCMVQ
jgi:hypothetical protein